MLGWVLGVRWWCVCWMGSVRLVAGSVSVTGWWLWCVRWCVCLVDGGGGMRDVCVGWVVALGWWVNGGMLRGWLWQSCVCRLFGMLMVGGSVPLS